MSVVKIDKERIYDDKGTPQFGAINDPRMGTMDKELRCFTCKGKQDECPGHFGHIELAKPVYHAGLLEFIRKILRCVCFNCSKLLLVEKERLDELRRCKNNTTRFGRALRICDTIKKCDETLGCGYMKPKFTKSGLRIQVEYMDSQQDVSRDRKQVLYPDEALKVLEKISDEDCELLGFRPAHSRPENMIIKNLAVAPPPVRPSVMMSSTNRSEDDLTYAYQQILKTNIQLQSQMQRGANQTTINSIRDNLQYYVATLMDNEIQGQPTQRHKSGKPLKAIRARLRGKEGRLRGNLMGKRVDFSSRSVITPDPILQLDQLGVPLAIALNLTVPETVTSENIDEMRRLVHNGPNNWPGAKYILRHDDRQIDLASLKNRSDAHLEPGYRVERHLKNNDYVIFNRQPSLHKMSLMGHRVKVLPYSTFRLNLSVTTPYNADFDGDEMNMHVPQSYETIAEVKEIMAVPNQIVSPKDNKPVMGIVQDSLLGVMLFTLRDTFIEKELVMNLLMWANYEDGKFPTPAILKPKPLWTGKQIFSLIIPQINLVRYSEKKSDNWASAEDKNILIQQGELLCGNLTKGTIGSSSGGMIHIIWKEKGPYPCRDFLSNTQLIINNWLHQNGFTVGVQDIIASKKTLDEIRKTLKEKQIEVQTKLLQAQLGELEQQPGKNMMESFEFEVNRILNDARDYAGNTALRDLYQWNRLKAMVTAGSKGSNLNISQIMACVGQQNVEGKRIPFGFHQRSLPHFSKDDFGPESKGFVENCYLSGLTPQEFFFHAMGGREGLIDTAVKTAETGYIQRRLIKALEDVMVKYDGTVRTSKEQVIQFLYGEDGMAGEHIEDLKIDIINFNVDNSTLDKKCNFLPLGKANNELEQILSSVMPIENAKSIVSDASVTLKLREEYNQIMKDRDDLRSVILKGQSGDEVHLSVNIPRIIWNAKEQFKIKPNSKTDLHPSYVLQKLTNLSEELTPIPGVTIRNDPLILQAKENSTWLFKIYLRSLLCTKNMIQCERMSKNAFDWVIGEIKSRFEQAIVNPGEMIGPIGAQSIGEPATQMTLNTFHFAGVSSKNVTLGVPRLKEIINVAKNIKTPSMKIYLLPKYKTSMQAATKFGGKIEYTTLNHVVRSSAIYYDPDPEHTIVREDEELVQLYNDVLDIQGNGANPEGQRYPPWLLRFVLDNEKINFKHLSMEIIEKRLHDSFQDQIQIMHSDDNADKLVLRLRVTGVDDINDEDDEETICMYLKELQDKLLNDMILKGIPEITKVTFSKYNETEFDEKTGAKVMVRKDKDGKEIDNWLVETDGVALSKVLGFGKIDFKRTTSNDIQEILRVLGIEAVRLTLINELRFVLGTYGIYVNYRHLSTLCDVMTQRGILTSITRHGINRVDTGPLRKCSFEETVEILYEAAVFAETDFLSGITENIIMGQLAPYGTGCFDLVIDKEVLQDYAQTKPDEEDEENQAIEFTPMQDDPYLHYGTPLIGQTPVHGNYIGSEYSMAGTPGYHGDMSPGPGANFGQSPAYGMSPNYNAGGQSPVFRPGQSPIYQPYQSPIYQPTAGGPMMSPSHQSSLSPSYSPTNSRQSPSYAQHITPVYNASGVPSSSPSIYSSKYPGSSGSSGQASGTYNPTNPMSSSASYSPTSYNQQQSPRYVTQTSPGYGRPGQQAYSPQYSPTSQMFGSRASPRYGSSSSSGGPNSSIHPTPGSPGSSSLYIPSSPCYTPSNQPFQAPVRPAFIGGGGSPIEDSSSDNDSGDTPKPK